MKRAFEVETTTVVDVAVHAKVCLKFFDIILKKKGGDSPSSSSGSSDAIRNSIEIIYSGAPLSVCSTNLI